MAWKTILAKQKHMQVGFMTWDYFTNNQKYIK
jgi:hypothetical protein